MPACFCSDCPMGTTVPMCATCERMTAPVAQHPRPTIHLTVNLAADTSQATAVLHAIVQATQQA